TLARAGTGQARVSVTTAEGAVMSQKAHLGKDSAGVHPTVPPCLMIPKGARHPRECPREKAGHSPADVLSYWCLCKLPALHKASRSDSSNSRRRIANCSGKWNRGALRTNGSRNVSNG